MKRDVLLGMVLGAVGVTTPGLVNAQPVDPPPPGDESGRIDEPDGPSTTRRVGRAVLYVPRGLFEIVVFPLRASVWAVDRYDLVDRAYELFYNDDGTLGLYPTLRFESGYGVNVGARFVRKFNTTDRLSLFGGYGGRSRELSGSVNTGDRFGGLLGLEARAEYEQRPKDRFYGIGNGDEVDPPMAGALPIDPLVDDTAVDTRYSRRIARASLTTDLRLVSFLHLRGSGALSDVDRSSSDDGPRIEDVYAPMSLVAFDTYRLGYGELELRWDDRSRASMWEPPSVMSRGWFAAIFGGFVMLDEGPGFWRYGGEVQHFLRLAEGPRVLVTRLRGEAVTGELEEVPFTELPHLGGSTTLRGYPIERFRDRIAAVGSLEYQWDLSRAFSGSLFVDAGRVYAALDELTFDGLRVGYGVALEGQTDHSFVARVSVASSIDGGVFVNLYLDPLYEVTPRVRRR